MAVGGHDRVAGPQVPADGGRLGRRFDDDDVHPETFFLIAPLGGATPPAGRVKRGCRAGAPSAPPAQAQAKWSPPPRESTGSAGPTCPPAPGSGRAKRRRTRVHWWARRRPRTCERGVDRPVLPGFAEHLAAAFGERFEHVVCVLHQRSTLANQRLGPLARGSRGEPGTAITSRPCSSARRAVIREPERAAPSTITTPRESPDMMRLRRGKWRPMGTVPSGCPPPAPPCPPPADARRAPHSPWDRGHRPRRP